VLIHRLRLPKPDLQRTIFRSDHSRIGRVDFYFESSGAIGEFDGTLKYNTPDDVRREKLREDELRAETGAAVARWTWDDLYTPPVVARRIRRAINVSLTHAGKSANARAIRER